MEQELEQYKRKRPKCRYQVAEPWNDLEQTCCHGIEWKILLENRRFVLNSWYVKKNGTYHYLHPGKNNWSCCCSLSVSQVKRKTVLRLHKGATRIVPGRDKKSCFFNFENVAIIFVEIVELLVTIGMCEKKWYFSQQPIKAILLNLLFIKWMHFLGPMKGDVKKQN